MPQDNAANKPTGMDLATLYAGSDLSYLTDDPTPSEPASRGDNISDDPAPADPPPADPPPADDPPADPPPANDPPADDPPVDEGNNAPGQVPKWRLDQQTKKLRERERELEALKAQIQGFQSPTPTGEPQQPSPPTQQANSVDAELKTLREQRNEIRDKYEEAIIDGDTTKVKTYREQMDAVDDKIFDTRMRASMEETSTKTKEQTKVETELNAVASDLQKDYSVLDPNSDIYDADMVTETVAYRNALMELGRGPGDALREAGETIMQKYGIKKAGEEKAPTASTPPANDPPANDPPQNDMKQKTQAAQPNKMPGTKNEPKVHDVPSMTEKEFDEMDPEKRAELRGDYRV